MKMKDEQKEILKAVSKKMGEKISEDIRKTDPQSFKRPMVMLVLVVAVVGILRDPMSLLIGIVFAIVAAMVMSTSAEDLKNLLSSFKKEEVAPKAEEKKAIEAKESSEQEKPK
jgi:hypothetical protein